MEQPTHTFDSYLPMDRRQAMANEATLGTRVIGAVLFVDISGFTPLTSRLSEQLGSDRGAEELDRVLNRVFELLISRVHHYRGSVIGFSGDAITCWFNGDNGLWATACALEMQEALEEIDMVDFPGGAIPLAVKASVTAGAVRRFVVGDERIQIIDVLAGELIDRVADGEKAATSGEVVVSSDVAKTLDERLVVLEERPIENGRSFVVVSGLTSPVEGRPWLDVPAESLAQARLQPWILPPVYERLVTGHDQYLAELRHSVVLFLQFGGLDYDSDQSAGEKLNIYIRWVQGIVDHYGGSVIDLTIGDKGSYLLCSFGAPISHEDDARRAASAALDLCTPPTELSFISSEGIGLSQGLMFSGNNGAANRRTYSVLGDDTNIAARLMEQAAAGQILVSDRFSNAAASSHRFEELEPVTVKGFSDPIAVYQLLGERQTAQQRKLPPRKTEMVGRSAERLVIVEKLEALQAGVARGALIIEGEAGIGKSRLVEELLEQAQAREMTIYLGAADAIEKNAAYFAWRAIFWELFALDFATDTTPPVGSGQFTRQREQVLAYVKTAVPGLEHLAPLLNAVLPFEIPDNVLTAQMQGEAGTVRTNELLTALLAAKAGSLPMLIVLEDAHWLDSASWVLARQVAREISPLQLVIATRPIPDPIPKAFAELKRQAATTHLILTALPPQDTLQMVSHSLGVDSLPDPVSELLLEKASGHPFFSEELAYALRDGGLIEIKDGHCRLLADVEALNALSFPDSIDSVIISRIDLLTAQQQLTLKVASVIGRIFAYGTLRDVHPVETDTVALHDQLNTLQRLDITPIESPEPDLSYIFKHIITQEVSYNLMSFAQRQDLHQVIAKWLEKTYSEDLSPYYTLLAYHWRQALGDNYGRSDLGAKAVDYLEKAAQQSLDRYANREAAGYYSDILHLNEHLGIPTSTLRRARWLSGLGEANLRLGNWKEARINMEAALALMGRPVATNGGVLTLRTLALAARQFAYRLRSTWPRTVAELDQEELSAILVSSDAYSALGVIYYFFEELYLFLYVSFSQINLTERLGPSPQLLEAYGSLSITVGSVPIHSLARAYGRWAIEMSRDISDISSKAVAFLTIGVYQIHAGMWEEGRGLLLQVCEFSDQLGNRRDWDQGWALISLVHQHRGEYRKTAETLDKVSDPARRYDDPQAMTWRLTGKAHSILWLNEDVHEALTLLQQAESLLTIENLTSADIIDTHGLLAKTYMRLGNHDLATQHVNIALDQIDKTAFILPYAFAGFLAPVEVYLELWELAGDQADSERETIDLARKGLKIARKMGRIYPIFEPQAWLYQGRHDWLSGKSGKAKKAWIKSIDFAQQLSMPGQEAMAHYEYGRHSPLDDPDRLHHLQRAIELFSVLEVPYYLNLAQAELDA